MNPHSSINYHVGSRLCRLTLFLFLVTLAVSARAGVITLTAEGSTETNGVAELNVGPYEVADVITFKRVGSYTAFYIEKDGRTFTFTDNVPAIIAGPAKIRLVAGQHGQNESAETGLCTIRVAPEAYPPDRAILVPPGTNAARVTMECSTNLVNWFTASNGVYGPLLEAKFFRIKLAPVP